MSQPRFFLLAGINGAGKSTFYRDRLECLGVPFVNADIIAQELDPGKQVHSEIIDREAQRLANERRVRFLSEGKSFISETFFSHPSKIQLLKDAKAAGFLVTLVYIHVADPAVASLRVGDRIDKGGHSVPLGKILSRYPRVVENIQAAKEIPDHFFAFDNTSRNVGHQFVMHLREGTVQKMAYRPFWSHELFPKEILLEDSMTKVNPVQYGLALAVKKGESLRDAGKNLKIDLPWDSLPQDIVDKIEKRIFALHQTDSKRLTPSEFLSITNKPQIKPRL